MVDPPELLTPESQQIFERRAGERPRFVAPAGRRERAGAQDPGRPGDAPAPRAGGRSRTPAGRELRAEGRPVTVWRQGSCGEISGLAVAA